MHQNSALKGIDHPKMKMVPCMNFFLLLNTNEDILKSDFLQNIFFFVFSRRKKFIHVWNNVMLSK